MFLISTDFINYKPSSESQTASLSFSSRTGQCYHQRKTTIETQQLIKKTNITYQLGTLLPAKWKSVVRLEPLSVGSAVHKDNAVLHQGLGSHQLIVRGVVDHVNDPGLAGTA